MGPAKKKAPVRMRGGGAAKKKAPVRMRGGGPAKKKAPMRMKKGGSAPTVNEIRRLAKQKGYKLVKEK